MNEKVFKTPDDPTYYTYPDGDRATVEEIAHYLSQQL